MIILVMLGMLILKATCCIAFLGKVHNRVTFVSFYGKLARFTIHIIAKKLYRKHVSMLKFRVQLKLISCIHKTVITSCDHNDYNI